MSPEREGSRQVFVHLSRPGDFLRTHEGKALMAIADVIARLEDWHGAGLWDEALPCSAGAYFVPDETLLASDARRLGITSAADLFGGVVPYPFVRTKAIT